MVKSTTDGNWVLPGGLGDDQGLSASFWARDAARKPVGVADGLVGGFPAWACAPMREQLA